MAFARKSKKKNKTRQIIFPKKSSRPDFFQHRHLLFSKTPPLSTLSSLLSQADALQNEQHRLPVKHEEAVNRNGRNDRSIYARVSQFQETIFTLHRQLQSTESQIFTGEGS